MSLDAFNEQGALVIMYECDHSVDGEFELCDRQVRGSKRMLSEPTSDWWIGLEYGFLRVYCPAHKGNRK